jgi:WD40 repeat protein/serine/threonine protein kinase
MASNEVTPLGEREHETQREKPRRAGDPHATPMPDTDGAFEKADVPLEYAWPKLAGYDVLSELGRGGMGVVYKARQVGLNRLVALKMILHGAYAGPSMLRRFKTEAEAVAQLHHPNIVQVYDSGEWRGEGMSAAVPYFSLEFVEGGSLDKQLRGNPQPPRAAAELVEKLARAVHFAHQKGIIHRDLKPGNILLEPQVKGQPVRPDPRSATVPMGQMTYQQAQPKITDFGLAKQVWTDSGQTRTGDILGTPSYMAPEQASGNSKAIGPATDVYALGAILYEMLTGRPPFKGATAADTVLQVLNQEPVPVKHLQPSTPQDLQTICAKCLQKDPARRYASAEDLADDLASWLRGEPILARPVGPVERLARWCRRNPAIAGLAAAVVAALLLGILAAGTLATIALAAFARERGARIEADTNSRIAWDTNQRLEEQLYANRIAIAERELSLNHDVGLAGHLLGLCPAHLRGWEWDYLMRQRDGSRPPLKGHNGGLWMAAFSPDGKRVATCSIDGTAKVWDAAAGKELLTFRGHELNLPFFSSDQRLPIMCIAWSPDGKTIATGSLWPNLADPKNIRKAFSLVKIWEADTGKELLSVKPQLGLVQSVDFSPDGRHLALSSLNEDFKCIILDVATGKDIRVLEGHKSHVHCIRYSPDGALLATASTDGIIKFWDAARLNEVRTIQAHRAPVFAVAFSPDGGRLASASFDGTVKLWDVATGEPGMTLRGHTGMAAGIVFSPDGKRIATSGFDKTVRLWDAESGSERLTLRGHRDSVMCVDFSPDGRRLVSASFDFEARIWDATPLSDTNPQGIFTLKGHSERVNCVAFSPDGQLLATSSWDGTIRLWNARDGAEVRTLTGHAASVWGVAFSPDGKRLASAGWDHTAKVWDVATGQPLLTFKKHVAPVHDVAFTPDGQHVVSCGWDGLVWAWDAATGRELTSFAGHLFPVLSIAVSPDGRRVASGSGDRNVKVWELATAREVFTCKGHEGLVHRVAFSPDGQRLASASWDHTARLWNASNGKAELVLSGHDDRVQSITFSSDGRHVVTASEDKSARFWDAATGKMLGEPLVHRGVLWSVAFSPDNRRIATGGWSSPEYVRTWPTPLPRE